MKNRWIGAGIAGVLIVAGVALLLFAPRETPKTTPETSMERPPAALAPTESTPETPAAVAEKPAAAGAPVTAAFPSAKERPEVNGRGRVFGTAKVPAEAGRLEISIALHRVPAYRDTEFSYDDTFVGETKAGADGGFEFKDLPFATYILFATATGYTMNGSAGPSAEQPEDEVTLTLVPGAEITGRVVNQNHEPVAGARIFVAGWDIQGQKRMAPRDRSLASQQRSDENGNFKTISLRKSLSNEPGYQLAVKADGFATFVSGYIQAGTQGVELMLKPGGIVSGMLMNATTGEPIPDKTIRLDSEVTVEKISAATDAEGFFFLQDVPAGQHSASLGDDELVITPESAKFQVAQDAPTDEVVLQAMAGGKISGRIYDSDTGSGIGGVEMYASAEELQNTPSRNVKTGADGTFQFKGLRTATYTVRLNKPDGYPEPRRNEEERRVSASVGGETTGVDFALSRGLTIAGRAVDEEGKGLADVSVSGNAERANSSDYTQSKDDGTFVLAGYEAGQTVRLWAQKEGYAHLSTEPATNRVVLEESSVSGIKVIFGQEASISGTVVDETGQPKAGAEVRAHNVSDRIGNGSTSGADGAIKIDKLKPGEYYFVFPNDGMWTDGGASKTQQRVKVAKGESVTGVRILYTNPEGMGGKLTITGRVTDTQNRPVNGAEVMSTGYPQQRTRTDGTGNYTITGLNENNEVSLQAFSYAHSPAQAIRAKAGDRDVNFVLKGLATIEGRVITADAGQPVTSFRVRYSNSTREFQYYSRDQFMSVQDPEGRFKLTGVPDGANQIEVRADNYADTLAAVSGVVGGETKRDVVVRLDSGVEVAGRVVDGSGKGLGGAQIFVGAVPNFWERENMKRASSTSDGSFHLTSLPSGQTKISAAHEKFALKTVAVNLVPRVENKVEIVLTAGAIVEGAITLNGKPIGGARISASAQNDERKETVSDSAGRYQLAGLPAGRVHLNPVLSEIPGVPFKGQSAQIQVQEGFVTEMNFNFVSGTSTIEGVLYEAPGKPWRQQTRISLNIQREGGASEYQSTRTDGNGAFIFENVPAGQARISAYVEGRGPKNAAVTVGEQETVRKDILLYGGGAIRVRVSGAEEGTTTQIIALNGSLQVSQLNMAFFERYQQDQAGYAQVNTGEGTMSNLEPGQYTVVVYSLTQISQQVGVDPFALAKWGSQVVDVVEGQETAIQIDVK